MRLRRRNFLRLAASSATLPVLSRFSWSQDARPLAERLADYANGLRFDSLDAATIEQVKVLVIDTLGCGLAAFDEQAVRACREIALVPASGASTVIGTSRRTTPDLASFANGAAFRFLDL